ncbi:transposase, IS204/IS1001/IS1096/IS1165 family [endosymbiont of Riftia pachyptila (vent Ph05)]|uniref:Transposase, IS204/IS1001/IS1096/IS1165 family n=1 Tax=endosymbiont of Riftia pachyptila (vent Ph05) TaxID=1048808 RepID=G2DI06_9GAMM|nr:transposase, IS204/IS1001/IS1096/IS1165 family [endosymbiont of Riftia pachyptila (vent Ph05)]
MLYACEGRDHSTVERFTEDLTAHGGDAGNITAACTDMPKAFIKGVGAHLPNADLTFDKFHVVQLANKAVDEVRRQEVKEGPILRNSRWCYLKDQSKLSGKQSAMMYCLSRSR